MFENYKMIHTEILFIVQTKQIIKFVRICHLLIFMRTRVDSCKAKALDMVYLDFCTSPGSCLGMCKGLCKKVAN